MSLSIEEFIKVYESLTEEQHEELKKVITSFQTEREGFQLPPVVQE